MNLRCKPVLTSHQKGISLIVVLMLIVVIGLMAAASMRSATSSQRVTNNVRMDNMAQQYAESALRYCEAQLQIPEANVAPLPTRVNSLRAAAIPAIDMTLTNAVGAWENPVSWTGDVTAGAAAATRTALTDAQYGTSATPARAPECVVETQTLGSPAFTVTVVTARGFSSDYRADANGKTTRGAVVWLQSILNM